MVLFVLYALVMFTLLVLYFVLSYRDENYAIRTHSTHRGGSTGEVVDDHHHNRRSSIGALGTAGIAGAGLAALNRFRRRSSGRIRSRSRSHGAGRSRSRHRSQSRSRYASGRLDVVGSRAPSESYISEKYPRDGRDERTTTWRDRLLKVGAVAGGAALLKNVMGRRRDGDDGRHHPRDEDHDEMSADDASQSYTQDSTSRISRLQEEGRSPTRDYRHQPLPRQSPGASSVSSRTSLDSRGRVRRHGRDDHHKIRDGVATMGALGLMRAAFQRRRDRKEQRRIDELKGREMEEERLARKGRNGVRYTGDGFPRKGGRRGSVTSTDDYSTQVGGGRAGGANDVYGGQPQNDYHHHHHGLPPPVPMGAMGSRPGPVTPTGNVTFDTNVANATAPLPMPVGVSGGVVQETSGSEAYISPGGRHHHRHRPNDGGGDGEVGATAVPAGSASHLAVPTSGMGGVVGSNSRQAQVSPPISVKVKYHGDEGRHVTLRRLPESGGGAAGARGSRRRESSSGGGGVTGRYDRHNRRHRRHRHRDSESEISGTDDLGGGGGGDVVGEDRWQQVEEMERAQAEEQQRQQEQEQRRRRRGQQRQRHDDDDDDGVSGLASNIPMPTPQQTAIMTARNQGLVPPPPLPAVTGSIHNHPRMGPNGNGNGNGDVGGTAGYHGPGPGPGTGGPAGPARPASVGDNSPGAVTTTNTTTVTDGGLSVSGPGGVVDPAATRRQRRRAERAQQLHSGGPITTNNNTTTTNLPTNATTTAAAAATAFGGGAGAGGGPGGPAGGPAGYGGRGYEWNGRRRPGAPVEFD